MPGLWSWLRGLRAGRRKGEAGSQRSGKWRRTEGTPSQSWVPGRLRWVEGRGLVWAHREEAHWPAVEQPSEAACFSHSPPDQSLADYNQRRRLRFVRRFQRGFRPALRRKTADRYAHWARLHQELVLPNRRSLLPTN